MTSADGGPPLVADRQYELTLFVSGAWGASAQALLNVRAMCDAHLSGRHQLNVVDLQQDPTLAAQHGILATPTLVKERPLPVCLLVGDMSDHLRVLAALDLGMSADVAAGGETPALDLGMSAEVAAAGETPPGANSRPLS